MVSTLLGSAWWVLIVSHLASSQLDGAFSGYDKLVCVVITDGLAEGTQRPYIVTVVKSCREPARKETMENCLKRFDLSTSSVLDIVPVMDIKTNITYRNIYCAMCRGVKPVRIKFWFLRFKCTATANVELLDVADIVRTLSKTMATSGCEMTFREPRAKNLIIQPPLVANECYFLINECYVTGYIKEAHTKEDATCKTGSLSPMIYAGLAFKNLACSDCNDVQRVRNVFEKQEWLYSTWLQMSAIPEETTDVTEYCYSGTFYHEEEEQCAEVRCSPFRLFRNGTCTRIPQVIEHYSYRLCLRVVPLLFSITLQQAFNFGADIHGDINGILHNRLAFDDLKIEVVLFSANDLNTTVSSDSIPESIFSYYEWHIKIRISNQNPELILVNLAKFNNRRVRIYMLINGISHSFSVVVKDCFYDRPFIPTIAKCLTKFPDTSLCSVNLRQGNFMDARKSRFVVGFSFQKNAVSANPFDNSPVSTERSILEMRESPFIETNITNMLWEEAVSGFVFSQIGFLPFVDFFYGKTINTIWVQENIYLQLFNGTRHIKKKSMFSRAPKIQDSDVVIIVSLSLTLGVLATVHPRYLERGQVEFML